MFEDEFHLIMIARHRDQVPISTVRFLEIQLLQEQHAIEAIFVGYFYYVKILQYREILSQLSVIKL